jgi:hypothetical protein
MPMQQNDENNDLCFINDVVFFNSYASDWVCIIFSNTITIGIVVIKNYIIDSDKIHAQIQENKKKSLRNKVVPT